MIAAANLNPNPWNHVGSPVGVFIGVIAVVALVAWVLSGDEDYDLKRLMGNKQSLVKKLIVATMFLALSCGGIGWCSYQSAKYDCHHHVENSECWND